MVRSRAASVVLALLLATPFTTTGAEEPVDVTEHSAAPGSLDLRGLELTRAPAETFASALGGQDASLRLQAARALGRLHDPDAVAVLEPALTSDDPALRSELAFALGHYPGTAPTLLSTLGSEHDPAVRAALLDAIGRSGDATAAGTLIDAMGTGTTAEAIAACHAIGRLGVRGELVAPGPDVVEPLLHQLGRVDVGRRRAAAFALARTKPADLAEQLMDSLLRGVEKQADTVARAWLVRASATGLDATRWERAVSIAAQDASLGVRIALARGLATRGDEGAASQLAPLLQDDDRAVRIAALEAAGRLPWDDDWEQPLQAMLQLLDEEQLTRALPLLADAGRLAEPEGWLNPTVDRNIRAAMIGSLSDPNALASYATEDRSQAVRTTATERLLTLDPAVDRELLWPLLEQPDPVVAGLAAQHLAEAPDDEFIERIQMQLVDRNDYPGLLALLEALGQALETMSTEGTMGAPRPLPGGLRSQVTMRVSELRNHDDLALRAAAERVGAALGLGPGAPAAFPKLFTTAELDALLGARVLTSRGELAISFRTDAAPYTVQRWVELAESGWFDGLSFHRVVPDFVVQGGCPRGDGYGGPHFALPDELSPLPYHAGAVGMATDGPDTAGSQWFVTLSPQPHLDGDYTLFGELVQGEDVLRRLRQGDHIEGVVIERRSGPSSHP